MGIFYNLQSKSIIFKAFIDRTKAAEPAEIFNSRPHPHPYTVYQYKILLPLQ
jgi:hypothetical protein